ncbi:MAG TPA: CdaR family protein [Anaerolineales bacterium]|nr:CdaR family protein [Anaerolineales bacterium]
MFKIALQWFSRNISTLLLAFAIAVVVWVSAVLTADPNEERIYTRNLSVVGQSSNLMQMTELPTQVRITLKAPRSILTELNNNPALIQATLDLSGLDGGNHQAPIEVQVDDSPVRVLLVEPEQVEVLLEKQVSRTTPVQLEIIGEPPIGYRKGTVQASPDEVTITGSESQVNQVDSVVARLDITGLSDTIQTNLPVTALNSAGDIVSEVAISPRAIAVTQPINLLGGFRSVVVTVITEGQIEAGYRLTNISVSPRTVTVFSSDPQVVADLPGFVETMPLNLNSINDDLEVRVQLDLPDGVELVNEESVLVQIGVAAIEGSVTVTVPIEAFGQSPNFAAQIAPKLVDLIVSGPIPVLDLLTSDSFRVLVDINGLTLGTYQLPIIVDLVPDEVVVDAILPETVEVTITPPATPTVTPIPVTPTP